MTFRELDTVVLKADIPPHGLRRGDIGAVVHVYGTDGVEVEFVLPDGRTQAVITLRPDDVRPINNQDVLTVRRFDAA